MMGNDMNMRVVLGANISKFKSGMAQAKLTLKNTSKQMDGFLHKMGNRLPMAAALAGAAITAMTVKVAKWGDDIAKQSKALSVSTEFLSEMDFVAQRAGASMGDITKSIGLLSKAAVDAEDGLATYVRAFNRLGVDIHKGNGELKDTEDLFMDVINALKGIENGTLRLGLAKQVLGRGGASLLPLIDEDVEGLRKLAKEMGRSLSAEKAKQAENFADAMLNVKSSIEGLVIASTSGESGNAIKFLDTLTSLIIKFNKVGGLGGLAKKVISVDISQADIDRVKGVSKALGLGNSPGMYDSDWSSNYPDKAPTMPTGGLYDPWMKTKEHSYLYRTMSSVGMKSPYEPILKDIDKVGKGLMTISTETERVDELVLISAIDFQRWGEKASMATNTAMNAIGDFWSELKAGEGVLASLGVAFERFATDAIAQMIRMKIFGWNFDRISGFGALKGAGSTGPNIDWPMDVSSSSGNVTVNLTNSSGLPMDVTSSNVSTGLNGQTQIDLMINSSLSRQASSGRLDPLMKLYGARRQGVSR